MKTLLKPMLIGLACGVVTWSLSGSVTFWLLLHYRGFDHAPVDPDYHAAFALGTWGCFIQALVCGIVVGMATAAMTTWHLYRRKKASPLQSVPSGS